jgi:Cu+-exporting ATPase
LIYLNKNSFLNIFLYIEKTLMENTISESLLHLSIKGMGCASCVATVEQALKQTPGVVSAQVDLAAAKASVIYQPNQVNIATLQQTIRNSGYEAIESSD